MPTKDQIEKYLYDISNLLKQENFFDTYAGNIARGRSDFKLSQRFYKKKFDTDWIDIIEESLIPMDNIVRNPRKFIVIEEDIVDISLARNITTESVKHLATHTNLISSVNEEGMVLPNKILNTSKEETYEVYENRFIYTLLVRVVDFVRRRFDLIKKADAQSDEIAVTVNSEYSIDETKYTVNWDTAVSTKLDNMYDKGEDTLNNPERVSKIHTILNSFLSSPFAKEMVSCAPVRPPIQRTNVIMKNPDFKKMLVLWQFIEGYVDKEHGVNRGFEVVAVNDSKELAPSGQDKYRTLMYINSLIMETLLHRSVEEAYYTPEEEEEKEDDKASEYISRDIDDFVPDDFPHLRMDIFETRRVYDKRPHDKKMTALEIQKMTAAIDRCLTQYKINKEKLDSERQRKLILKQIQETELAKKRALREAALDAKRKERQRIEAEKERIRQEKQAEKDRKIAEIRQKEEEIKREQHLHDLMLQEQEEELREKLRKEKIASEDRIRRDELRLEKIMEEENKRIALERRLMADQLERDRAIELVTPLEAEAMLIMKRKEIQRIRDMREEQYQRIKDIIDGHYSNMQKEQEDFIIDLQVVKEIEEFEEKGESLPDIDIENFGKGEISSMMYGKPEEKPIVEEKPTTTEPVVEEDSGAGSSFGLAFDDDDLANINFDDIVFEKKTVDESVVKDEKLISKAGHIIEKIEREYTSDTVDISGLNLDEGTTINQEEIFEEEEETPLQPPTRVKKLFELPEDMFNDNHITEQPTDEQPTEEQEEQLVEEQPTDEQEEQPTDEQEEQLVEEQLVEEQPTEEQPTEEQPTDEQEEQLVGEQPTDEIEEAPIDEIEEAPVDEIEEAPVDEIEEAPIDEIEEAPTDEIEEAPIDEIEEAPTDEIEEAPILDEELLDEPIEFGIQQKETSTQEQPSDEIEEIPAEEADDLEEVDFEEQEEDDDEDEDDEVGQKNRDKRGTLVRISTDGKDIVLVSSNAMIPDQDDIEEFGLKQEESDLQELDTVNDESTEQDELEHLEQVEQQEQPQTEEQEQLQTEEQEQPQTEEQEKLQTEEQEQPQTEQQEQSQTEQTDKEQDTTEQPQDDTQVDYVPQTLDELFGEQEEPEKKKKGLLSIFKKKKKK